MTPVPDRELSKLEECHLNDGATDEMLYQQPKPPDMTVSLSFTLAELQIVA